MKRFAIIAVMVLLFTSTLFEANAYAYTRSEVMMRARSWINSRVPYSQVRHFRGYRADCSGFVSYTLGLRSPGDTTVSLWGKTRPIGKNELKPGDILLARGSHVVLFAGWANAAHTKYLAYEQVGGRGSVAREIAYPYWGGYGRYVPRRYGGIRDVGIASSRGSARRPPIPLRVKLTRKRSDFNGDGASDISLLYGESGDKRSIIRLCSNKSGFNSAKVWTGSEGALKLENSKKTTGDFNGDGIADVALLHRNSNGSTSIYVFYLNKHRIAKGAKAWTSKPGGFNWWRVKMASGDFNGDGRDDLAFFHGAQSGQSSIWAFLSRKQGGFSPYRWWIGKTGAFDWSRAKILPGDFNGDGRVDLAFLYNYATRPTALWVFTTKPRGGFYPKIWWSAKPNTFMANRIKIVSGYFNWDKNADIAVLYKEPDESNSVITLLSNGAGKFSPRLLWQSTAGELAWNETKPIAGDFNADGLSDLALLRTNPGDNSSIKTLINANNFKIGFRLYNWRIDTSEVFDWNRATLAD